MSGQDPKNRNSSKPESREADINALLDGELDREHSEALKTAAAQDAGLARAIVEAWELQKGMDDLQLERAPASLTRKLKQIPREQAATGWGIGRDSGAAVPRWLLGGGLAAMAAVVISLVISNNPGPLAPAGDTATGLEMALQPAETNNDEASARQAAADLQIAFYYLDKAGFRVGQEINEVLNEELAQPVKDTLSKHMPYSGQTRKEKHA